jgi:hypothetical protein
LTLSFGASWANQAAASPPLESDLIGKPSQPGLAMAEPGPGIVSSIGEKSGGSDQMEDRQ